MSRARSASGCSSSRALGVVAAPLLILVFAPGFVGRDGQFGLAVDMLRFTFPYILFVSLTAFAGSVLNSHRRFAVAAFTPVLLNVVMIVFAGCVGPMLERAGARPRRRSVRRGRRPARVSAAFLATARPVAAAAHLVPPRGRAAHSEAHGAGAVRLVGRADQHPARHADRVVLARRQHQLALLLRPPRRVSARRVRHRARDRDLAAAVGAPRDAVAADVLGYARLGAAARARDRRARGRWARNAGRAAARHVVPARRVHAARRRDGSREPACLRARACSASSSSKCSRPGISRGRTRARRSASACSRSRSAWRSRAHSCWCCCGPAGRPAHAGIAAATACSALANAALLLAGLRRQGVYRARPGWMALAWRVACRAPSWRSRSRAGSRLAGDWFVMSTLERVGESRRARRRRGGRILRRLLPRRLAPERAPDAVGGLRTRMRLYRTFASLRRPPSPKPRAVAIGVFDGLHIGHQAILERARAAAAEIGGSSLVLTFEPTPKEFFSPATAPPRLTRFRERFEQLQASGWTSSSARSSALSAISRRVPSSTSLSIARARRAARRRRRRLSVRRRSLGNRRGAARARPAARHRRDRSAARVLERRARQQHGDPPGAQGRRPCDRARHARPRLLDLGPSRSRVSASAASSASRRPTCI